MIGSIRHRGLRRLFEQDDARWVSADQVERIKSVLGLLDAVNGPQGMNVPGLRLHRLKGQYRGYWSATVLGNWRIVFRFEGGDVHDVDLVDYH
jgi:proteic killer suppression protein